MGVAERVERGSGRGAYCFVGGVGQRADEGVGGYYRWDGDIDYKSWGCIKIMPTDIEDLFTRLDRAGWPKNLTLHVS
ncbi:hypothetical protein [Streptomyces sp. Wh19]|uniref:hypothetical protein n=1 Tax=Streptomyces sp. Wh19 TaxID=3076629 RepID=UPI0029589669|nr:hypothetical protein [Streptomyces sp. Wh19]MDV9201099.1 hypothetical protein [Streptomyces sp. Wh19]